MFNYFGTKWRLAKWYPEPRFPLIIEPFCGAAGYSLLYPGCQVWLNDYYPKVESNWKWLLKATRKDILALPELKPGERVSQVKGLSLPVRVLLKFQTNRACAGEGGDKVSVLAGRDNDFGLLKRRALRLCPKIRHWKITGLDYRELPNLEATWFIDPPYFLPPHKKGNRYRHHDIDYDELAKWCRSRKGQVIVCGGDYDDWLPFLPLRRHKGINGYSTEYFWTNDI